MALLHLARLTAPAMVKAGEGALIVTGNTSAQRGRSASAPNRWRAISDLRACMSPALSSTR